MSATRTTKKFVFPRWANYLLPALFFGAIGGGLYAPTIVHFGFSPRTTDVGYAPIQPVPFSHAVHAGQLGLDCRYCHTTVDRAAFAAVPPTQTCMNCHTNIKGGSPNVTKLVDSWQTGKPVEWVKVHDLPDYSYFNHSSHVNAGVGCVSCHGRIDQMEVVTQSQSLSMGWCIECHRSPEKHLRPRDQITNMNWRAVESPLAEGEPDPELAQLKVGLKLKELHQIKNVAYMTSCSTCHR